MTHKMIDGGDNLCGDKDTSDQTLSWGFVDCGECIKYDNRPLIVTPGFYDRHIANLPPHKRGNVQRGSYK